MRKIWEQYNKWLTVLLALMAIALAVIIAQAAAPPPKTQAEPPAEMLLSSKNPRVLANKIP